MSKPPSETKNPAPQRTNDGLSLDRRTALKGLSATAAAAMVGKMATGCAPEPGELPPLDFDLIRSRVDNVVLLMMENRSFDHYFGALSLEEGRTEVDGLTPGLSNPHPDGSSVEPYHAAVNCLEDPPHSWSTSRAQFAEGTNQGFVQQHFARWGDAALAREVMGYFGRDKLSMFYEMADNYVLCDRWFCSQMSSTWPNRFYSLAAQNGGAHGNDYTNEVFPSILNSLTDAGIEWRDYYSLAPFAALLRGLPVAEGAFKLIDDFFIDAQYGRLPPFTIIDPVYGRADDHPPAHPVAGQVFASLIYEALAASPQWDRTLFVISYDEHGGFYDHVAPPTAADDRAGEGFEQLGFRVPALVIGPWVKPGHVSKVTYDHTSLLAFVQNLWGLDPLTARDAAADPMLDVFDHEAMALNTPHPPVSITPIEADEEELYAPECTYLADGADHSVTKQPELEAFLDALPSGSPLDRREQIDEIWEDLLLRAERWGILRRKQDGL